MVPPGSQPRLQIRFSVQHILTGILSTLRLPLAWTVALVVATVPAVLAQMVLNGQFDQYPSFEAEFRM